MTLVDGRHQLVPYGIATPLIELPLPHSDRQRRDETEVGHIGKGRGTNAEGVLGGYGRRGFPTIVIDVSLQLLAQVHNPSYPGGRGADGSAGGTLLSARLQVWHLRIVLSKSLNASLYSLSVAPRF